MTKEPETGADDVRWELQDTGTMFRPMKVKNEGARMSDEDLNENETAGMYDGFNYANGTTNEVELEADDPPKSGEWVDVHDVLATPTDDEVAEGLRQGQEIDPEDDEDNGVS